MKKKKAKNTMIPPPSTLDIGPIVTDPFGSYTGLVPGLDEKPVQDADDL